MVVPVRVWEGGQGDQRRRTERVRWRSVNFVMGGNQEDSEVRDGLTFGGSA